MAQSSYYHGVSTGSGNERMELSSRASPAFHEPSSSADEWPHRDPYSTFGAQDTSPLPSPMSGNRFYQQRDMQGSRDYTIASHDSFNDKYNAAGYSDSQTYLPKEGSYGSGAGTETGLRHAQYPPRRPKGIAGWSRRKKLLIGGGSILAVIAIAAILGAVFGRSKGSGSSMADQAKADKSLTMGGDGTVVTAEDGSTFVYNNTFGGYWVSTPFDDSARPRSDVPALNESWDWSTDLINGVNLGGWLVLEPFITPALFEPYAATVRDEWGLCEALGSNLTAVLEEHYDTFYKEIDFAQMAEAGLNWVRFPVPYWMIETYEGEAYLEGVQWKYFLKGLTWARKYGIRVELDLHTVPGSQNGNNHSGRGGSIGFLNGVNGIVNAQRVTNYVRTLIEFVSQPQYSNLVLMMMPVNEPYFDTIGRQVMFEFYREVYETVRGITGIGQGKGPMIVMHDGFQSTDTWAGFMGGSDRLALETHHYLAFDNLSFPGDYGQYITRPCEWWASAYNTTLNNFGYHMAGEWCLASNDCGLWVNGIGLGSHYDGTYNATSFPNEVSSGDCSVYTDMNSFSDAFKTQLREMAQAYWDTTRNWIFWTWKCLPTSNGTMPNPLWSYRTGLENNYIPSDPRPQNYIGACSRLANSLNLPDATYVSWTPPLDAWMTGGAGAGTITADTASFSNWPPQSINSIPQASNLPTLTATGTPVTLSPSAYIPSASVSIQAGDGWLNPSDTAGWNVPVSGCSYLGAYDGVGAAVPTAPCTGAGQRKRSDLQPTPAAQYIQ